MGQRRALDCDQGRGPTRGACPDTRRVEGTNKAWLASKNVARHGFELDRRLASRARAGRRHAAVYATPDCRLSIARTRSMSEFRCRFCDAPLAETFCDLGTSPAS